MLVKFPQMMLEHFLVGAMYMYEREKIFHNTCIWSKESHE